MPLYTVVWVQRGIWVLKDHLYFFPISSIPKLRSIKENINMEIQMVFQDPYASLDPNHSVEWHLKRPLIFSKYKGNIDNRINELLNMVTLNPGYLNEL